MNPVPSFPRLNWTLYVLLILFLSLSWYLSLPEAPPMCGNVAPGAHLPTDL